MRKNMRIARAVITEVGPITINRRTKFKCRIIRFKDMEDSRIEYTLCIVNGHKGASRFEKLPVGTKLTKLVVYTEKGRNYVDGNSNFSIMRVQPLF